MHSSTKQFLRKIYREKRMRLSPEEFRQLNDQLMVNVEALEIGHLRTVHLFLPIIGNKEPDTYRIARWLRDRYPDIRLVFPNNEPGNHQMSQLVCDKENTLIHNPEGTPEKNRTT